LALNAIAAAKMAAAIAFEGVPHLPAIRYSADLEALFA
jgi:hypothetical protein